MPAAKSKPKLKPAPASQPASKSKSKPKLKSKPARKSKPKLKSKSKPKLKSKPARKSKPAPKSKSRPPARSEPKAKSRSATPTAVRFPFLGQGAASYYEWFEMWIWFADPVPKAQRKDLLKGAPPPCTLDAQWPDASLLWASTGDQWIQQHLIETYGTKAARTKYAKALARQAADDGGDGGDGGDDYLDDLIAGSEVEIFNAHIERWLHALHRKRPILFAARRQDFEAGGTRLGPWHEASLALFRDRVVPALAPLGERTLAADDLRRAPIAVALAYTGAASVPPAIRKLGERG